MMEKTVCRTTYVTLSARKNKPYAPLAYICDISFSQRAIIYYIMALCEKDIYKGP